MLTNRVKFNVCPNTEVNTPVVEALNKMKSFYNTALRMIWSNSLSKKRSRFLIFLFCLLSCHKITNGKEARMQRRFMWKQMHMEDLVNEMATRAYAMKNALSDLVPTIHSAMSNKAMDYFPSETTRIKYIIRNPTTNQPIKIIKMRPTKKIVKIIPKPTVRLEPKPILSHNKVGPTFPNAEKLKKNEMEQELITEGRLSFKSENEIFNKIVDREKYTEHTQQETDENHSWLPVADRSQTFSVSSIRPNRMTSLHTSIMAEPLQSQEKQIPKKSILSANDNENEENDDSAPQQKYYDSRMHTNSYEVTENIAEESIALPLIRDSQISLRIGTTPNIFATIHTTNKPGINKESNVEPISGSPFSENPPNYPSNFLRRFRERTKLSTTLPSITTTPLTLGTQKQRNTADLNALWTHNAYNVTYSRETPKLRSRFQGMLSHSENEKWPVNTSHRISPTENLDATKSVVFSSTTTAVPSVTQSVDASATRLKKQLFIPAKVSQNGDIRELRVHNRGKIKFGDKILTEKNK